MLKILDSLSILANFSFAQFYYLINFHFFTIFSLYVHGVLIVSVLFTQIFLSFFFFLYFKGKKIVKKKKTEDP